MVSTGHGLAKQVHLHVNLFSILVCLFVSTDTTTQAQTVSQVTADSHASVNSTGDMAMPKTERLNTPQDTMCSDVNENVLSISASGSDNNVKPCENDQKSQRELKQLMDALKNFERNMDSKIDKIEKGWHNGIS